MLIKLLPFLIPLIILALISGKAEAGLTVIDPTLVATNKANHARDFAEALLRKANQEQQIGQLLRQIAQADDYLKRFGHPGLEVATPEVAKLRAFLQSVSASKTVEQIYGDLEGSEIFKPDSPTSKDIIVDSEKLGERDASIYVEDAAANRSFEHYRLVRAEALLKRNAIRQLIASTTAQLQAATTATEINKIKGVLTALQSELTTTDQEIGIASAELLARHLESEAKLRLQAKMRLEDDRLRHKRAVEKHSQTFRLMTKPTFFRARRR